MRLRWQQILPLQFTEPQKIRLPSKKKAHPKIVIPTQHGCSQTHHTFMGSLFKKKKKWLLTKWQRQKGKKNDVLSILSYVFADDDPPCRACCVPFALLQVGESRSERGTEAQAQSFFFLIALSWVLFRSAHFHLFMLYECCYLWCNNIWIKLWKVTE